MNRPTFEIEDGLPGPAIGIDEAGRGCLAGPVAAAAAFINREKFPAETLARIQDSKTLSERQREEIFDEMAALPRDTFAYAFATADAGRIDETNILAATMESMREAGLKLAREIPGAHYIIDGNRAPNLPNAVCAVKGDSRSYSVAAASIVAKVIKDRTLKSLGREYPQFDFARHKGYGTAAHMAELAKYGPTPLHRKTYAPVRKYAQ
ncbi:MAG: ribonuclease HII [Rickettsiales bacterium]|nr:ribonuclease HII [Rickettsiales bacterium]